MHLAFCALKVQMLFSFWILGEIVYVNKIPKHFVISGLISHLNNILVLVRFAFYCLLLLTTFAGRLQIVSR